MRLVEIGHSGFRNLADGVAAPGPGVTLLLGDNGQGKTSFLEAIGVLATTKSFRRARAAEMACHGLGSYALHGIVESHGSRRELAIEVVDGVRTTRLGGATVELAEYVGVLTVVPITSVHAGIVRGAPQDRRDFLDRGVLGLRPGYLRTLSSLRRTLRHKAALLRQPYPPTPAELAAWNERLARDGAEVTLRRREYVSLLAGSLAALGPVLLPPSEQLELSLQDIVARQEDLARAAAAGEPLDREAVEAALLARMASVTQREVATRQVLVGPQRDELTIRHGSHDVKRYASSGQQRNTLLALKMAKVEVFRQRHGETPILLVDDVDTEVDPSRLGTFLERVGEHAQALLTSSKKELLGGLGRGALAWHVEKGLISPC